mmetsp:Transcript_54030/g.94893  ORF Transcript_54030/g.94893 Transcript_54030/m.94893 type:complete len:471 (-) Transcript_54030:124-1536(-)
MATEQYGSYGAYFEKGLNARQRKQVYMHSTIFDDGGPTTQSIYGQSQQVELHKNLENNLKARIPPDMTLPSPADIQCTQNAGHGAVMPSSVGVDRHGGYPRQRAFPSRTPRTSGPEVLVADGDAMPVVRAGGKDQHVPKEFWQTSVKLEWHDPRNELSRHKGMHRERGQMGAQDLKYQELSSELFGKDRNMELSEKDPRASSHAQWVDPLLVDSSLDKTASKSAKFKNSASTSYRRFAHNLSTTEENTMFAPDSHGVPEAPFSFQAQEDPANMGRRRQEKNFSDLFGTQMGERRELRGNREEVTGTRTCSFLDTRSEIAARNNAHWRPDLTEVDGMDLKEPATVSSLRKQAEGTSGIFNDYEAPSKPQLDRHLEQTFKDERVCFDTRDIMQASSEIARRSRLKEFADHPDHTDASRRWGMLGSHQMRIGMGTTPPVQEHTQRSRGNKGNNADNRSAKETKLASLQSSIFS